MAGGDDSAGQGRPQISFWQQVGSSGIPNWAWRSSLAKQFCAATKELVERNDSMVKAAIAAIAMVVVVDLNIITMVKQRKWKGL